MLKEKTVAKLSSEDELTIIETVPGFGRGSFGLGYAALHLSAALERIGVDVYLASLDTRESGYEACEAVGFPKDRFIHGFAIGRSPFRISPFLRQGLLDRSSGRKPIVHAHGLWTYASYVAGAVSRERQCPLILSPHGELEPHALTLSTKKKAIASKLFVQDNLARASCLCVLTEREKSSARSYGFTKRIEIIPSGVSQARPSPSEEIAAFRSRFDVKPNERVLLYLSRIAPIKNLPLLLKAFSRNVRIRPDWKLLIAGPDERGHVNEVRGLIRDLGIQDSVSFVGAVSGREKSCAFSAASLYVLPSVSEGLPIAVLEAMSYAKPILITDGWNFPIATDAVFAWRASTQEQAFEKTLLEAMNCSDEALTRMGIESRSIVRRHFDWEFIARRMLKVYESIYRGNGEQYSCQMASSMLS